MVKKYTKAEVINEKENFWVKWDEIKNKFLDKIKIIKNTVMISEDQLQYAITPKIIDDTTKQEAIDGILEKIKEYIIITKQIIPYSKKIEIKTKLIIIEEKND